MAFLDLPGLQRFADKIKEMFAGKSDVGHVHDASAITSGTLDAGRVPDLDASKITSGVLSLDRIPQAAMERVVTVANEEAMYQLTSDDVQTGDVVRVNDTQVMYFVVDQDKLSQPDGYMEFIAGEAASVAWANVTGKPEQFPPSAHTHPYAGSQEPGGAADSVANALTISLGGTSQGSFDGSSAISVDVTPEAIGAATEEHQHPQYENQNAFSAVKSGEVTVSATSATDTLQVEAGQNVSIVADASEKKLTVSATYGDVSEGQSGLMTPDMLSALEDAYALATYDWSMEVTPGIAFPGASATFTITIRSPYHQMTPSTLQAGSEGLIDRQPNMLYGEVYIEDAAASVVTPMSSEPSAQFVIEALADGATTQVKLTIPDLTSKSLSGGGTGLAPSTVTFRAMLARYDQETKEAHPSRFLQPVQIPVSPKPKVEIEPTPGSSSVSMSVGYGFELASGGFMQTGSTELQMDGATSSMAGLMSAADKAKLDGVAEGADKYVLPVATSDALGGVSVGYVEDGKNYPVELDSGNRMFVNVPWTDTTYTLSSFGITASATELNYMAGVTSGVQGQIDAIPGTISAAVAAEAAERQKQDGLLEDMVDGKLGPQDVLAGDNVSVSANPLTGQVTVSTTMPDVSEFLTQDVANATYAPKAHTHAADDVTSGTFDAARIPGLDASKITSGTLSIDRLPQAALERLVVVEDDDARYALTTGDVQLGDVVKVESTGLMYYVKDTSHLADESGYEAFTAGTASSVPWSGVTGKPSDFPPSPHTHQYAGSSAAGGAANSVANALTISLNGTSQGAYDGSAAKSVNVTAASVGAAAASHSHADATDSTAGFMSAEDKEKLDGIADNANNYVHPSHTAHGAGLYKVTVDSLGHVSAATAVAKSDITALGIPGTDTWVALKGSTSSNAGTAGYAPAPAAGASNRYLRCDGTWSVPPDTNTTYTLSSFGITATATELNYMDGVTGNVQTQLNGKMPLKPDSIGFANGLAMIAKDEGGGDLLDLMDGEEGNANLRVDRMYASGLSLGGTPVTATATELNYMDGVTSNVQTQLNGKAASNHTHAAATTSVAGFMSAADKTKLDGIEAGADVNQNAFSNVKVGSVTVAADSVTDTLNIAAGSNVSISADAGSDTVTISATDTTYGVATTGASGLMSAADKTKLDGIATGANKYVHPSYTAHGSGLYKVTVDAMGHVSAVTAVTKSDITALGIPGADTNTWIAFKGSTSSAAGTAGYAPAPAAGSANRYLRCDGTWVVPPDTNTTYSAFKGATSSAAGGAGLVPAPASGQQARFLRGDGTWAVPPDTNTTYSAGAGLVLSGTSFSLASSGVSAGSYGPTANVTGSNNATINVPQITVDAYGRVTSVVNRVYTSKDTNTTYSVATTSANGLMASGDKTKLNGIETGATKNGAGRFMSEDGSGNIGLQSGYYPVFVKTSSTASYTKPCVVIDLSTSPASFYYDSGA